MPSTSKAQYRWAQSCLHNPKHKGRCPSPEKAREFVEGVNFKKLPQRARKTK